MKGLLKPGPNLLIFFLLTIIQAKGDYVPGELIVRLDHGAIEMTGVDEVPISQVTINDSGLETALQSYETQSVEKLFKSPSAQAGLTYNDVRDVCLFTMNKTLDMEVVAEELEEESSVICAEPNYFVQDYKFPPNDPDFEYDPAHPDDPYQWGLHNDYTGKSDWDINILDAWDYNTGHTDILLGFVDTGLEAEHYDEPGDEFFGRIAPNGFINGGEDDSQGHGTNMVGVAAATTGNGAGHEGHGIAGVAGGWNGQGGVTLLIAKKEDDVATIIHCFDSLRERGANVINYSGGFETQDTQKVNSARLAIENAFAEDISIFIAAGNSHGPIAYPASLAEYDICSAVGGIDTLGLKPYAFSFGPELSFAAPGWGIYTTRCYRVAQDSFYECVNGTSPATAFASGVGALLYSEAYVNGDSLIDVDCKRIMQHSARFNPAYDTQLVTEIGPFNDTIGYGCIDAYEALRHLQAPYVLEHDFVTMADTDIVWSGFIEFTNSPTEGLPPGVYSAREYRWTGNISFSHYPEGGDFQNNPPWVWGLVFKNSPGYRNDNPNTAITWSNLGGLSYDGNYQYSGEIETYVYYLILRQEWIWQPPSSWVPIWVPVNKWAPNEPGQIACGYTVIRRDPTLFRSNPSGLSEAVLNAELSVDGLNLGKSTSIRYCLPQSSLVRIIIYDVTGREVTTLVSGEQPSGEYVIQWTGQDDIGLQAANGVYFISMETENQHLKEKFTLLR